MNLLLFGADRAQCLKKFSIRSTLPLINFFKNATFQITTGYDNYLSTCLALSLAV